MTSPLDIPLSPDDRALLMRCPLREMIPQAMKGQSAAFLARLHQVRKLRERGLIRVEIDADASDARNVCRVLHLTKAGLNALHSHRV